MMDKHYVFYDDIVRVPLIISWPNGIEKGIVCNEFVYSFLDLPPTLLDILGLEQKEFFHGSSLLPLLKQQQNILWRQQVVFAIVCADDDMAIGTIKALK